MGTGYEGTFVISWSQTEVDGVETAPVQALTVGAIWSWRGDALRVDGPQTLLRLDGADGSEALRRRAARMVQRLVGAAVDNKPLSAVPEMLESELSDSSFVVTDGAKSYSVTMIEVGRGSLPLLMFVGEFPPRDTELWVVHHTLNAAPSDQTGENSGGVICFTPGTWIETPDGPRRVEDLGEGDRVLTKDSGSQDIQWVGQRRMTGARLFAMPRLRPVRFSAGALGDDAPDQDLLVSPEHRMVIKGDIAWSLFNTPEVLVAAKDLVNGSTIRIDVGAREVTYIHLLLPKHEVIWANGVETESFHPANTALSTLHEADRTKLINQLPELEFDAHRYGAYARRNLSSSEAAILRHAA